MPQMRVATPIGLGQIASAVPVPDAGKAIRSGYQTGEFMANRGVRDEAAQLGLQQGAADLELGQQKLETGRLANISTRDQQRMGSLARGAAEIQGLDPAQQLIKLQARAERLKDDPRGNADTLEAIELLRRDPNGFQQTIGQAIDYGRITGVLSPVDRSAAEFGLKQQRLDIDREGLGIRRLESEQRALDRELNRETNEIKREQLGLQIKEKQAKIDETKRATEEAGFQRVAAQQSIVQSGEDTLKLMDDIVAHDGFSDYVGAQGLATGWGIFSQPKGGSDAAGVKALIDTLDAQGFLTAIQQFKDAGGSGALSDAEGARLSKAISSLDPSQDEKDFKKSLGTIRALIKRQMSRSKANMKREQSRNQKNPTEQPEDKTANTYY